MENQPIEEKWKAEWNLTRNEVILAKESNDQEQIIDMSAMERRDIAFIENLLEQERRRMSDEVKKLGYSVGELDKYVKGDVKDAYHDGFMTAKDKVKAIINK